MIFKKAANFITLVSIISLLLGNFSFINVSKAADPNQYNLSSNWRWMPSSASGASSLTAALINGVDSGAVSMPSNNTEELILSLDAAIEGGIFTYALDGDDQNAWTIVASESFNSTDGQNGSWSAIPTYLPGDENGATSRLRHVNISASPSPRWFKFSITNNYSAAQTIQSVGLHKFNGNNDYWLFVGASIVNMSIDYDEMNSQIKANYGYDPLIFNMGNSGKTVSWLNDNIDTIMAAHPKAKFVAIHMGGNNVSNNRPYATAEQSTLDSFDVNFRSVVQKIQNAGKVAVPGRLTFRNYPNDYPDKPGVYGGGMEQNGSLPFNVNLVDPIIASMTPEFYDASAGRGAVDLYTYFLNNQWALEGTDGVHPNTLGRDLFYQIWIDTAFEFVYDGSLPSAITPQTFNTPIEDAEELVTAAESSREATDINIAQEKLDEIDYWPEFSAQQAVLQARLDNIIPTTALVYNVDFGSNTYPSSPNWNNLNGITVGSSVNLVSDGGQSSSINLAVSKSFTSTTGSGSTFADYPYSATRDSFVVRAYTGTSSGITLSGLNLEKKYTFSIYSSGSASPSVTDFTINGTTNSVSSSANNSQIVQFNNIIPNQDGKIDIFVYTATGYGYLNAMQVRETENPPSCYDNILNQDEVGVDVGGVCGTAVTLNYSAGLHGSLSGDTEQILNSGTDGSPVTAVADSGYHFVDWSDGSTENPRTDANVTTSQSLVANFSFDSFTINYSAGPHGSLTGTTTQIINSGANGSAVTAIPDSGYHFVDWSDGSTQNPRTDTNVTSSKSLTANFSYTVETCFDGIQNQNETGIDMGGVCVSRNYFIDFGTVTTSGWNNVTTHQAGLKNQDIFDSGGATSTIDISIENEFSSLGSGGLSTTTGIYPQSVIVDNFYVQSGSSASVKFSGLDLNNSYSFKILPSRTGSGTRNSEYIINGVSVIINAINNASNVAEFHGVEPSGTGEIFLGVSPASGSTYAYLNAIELIENVGISSFTINYSSGPHGSLTGTTTQIINSGANGSAVTAIPDSGYHFVDWSDGSTQNPRTDTNVIASNSLTANFAINIYTINYSSGPHGSLTGTTTQIINSGANGSAVTAIPDSGYHFVDWSDGSTQNPRTDTNVIASNSLTANFAVSQYTISFNSAGGSITSNITDNYGATIITPPDPIRSGYVFTGWNPALPTTIPASNQIYTAGWLLVEQEIKKNGESFSPPLGVGGGSRNISAGLGAEIGGSLHVGEINFEGTNIFTYVTTQNNFFAPQSSNNWQPQAHRFVISDLDLLNNVARITFYSEPKILDLKLGDSKKLDIDSDGISDILVMFSDLYVNRAEITVRSLNKEEAIEVSASPKDNYYEQALIKEKQQSKKINHLLAKKMSGRLLLQIEERGQAWYVDVTSQKRYYLGRPNDAYNVIRTLGLGVSEKDYVKIIEGKLPSKLGGRIILRVQSKGEAYYINPLNAKPYYLGRPADAYKLLHNFSLGISNDNIRQIEVAD